MAWAAQKPAWFWNRGFKGRKGEFALLSRAPSADEIRGYYEQGRPGGEPMVLAGLK